MPIIRKLDERIKAKYPQENLAIIDKNDLVHMAHMDMNEYTSEANMLSNAISSIGKCDCNDIANKAFFSVEYKDDLESFTFMNMNGAPVGTAKMYDVKFSKLIESASYNRDTNTIDIIFENKDKISLDVDGLVPTVLFKDGLEKDEDSVKEIGRAHV